MESIQRSSPTKVNLCKRHIPIDPKCEACRTSPEDVLHAVWTCSLIQLAWEKEIWTHKLRSSQVLDYADLFSKVLESGSQQNFEAFITISWVLWNRWNKLRLNQAVEAIDQVNTKARAYLEEFASCNETPPPMGPVPTLDIKWQPPRWIKFKANYDGAVFQETNEAGIGVVVRDREGKVMASLV